MKHLVMAAMLLSFLAACGQNVDRTVGAECTSNDDCEEICLDGQASGFCTLSCTRHADCPSGTVCADTRGGVCLFTCEDAGDCQTILGSEYGCDDETDFDGEVVFVCVDD